MMHRFQKFARHQDGTASIEAVLWVSFFFFLVCLVIDTSLLFYGHARMLEVAQDANRELTIGNMTTSEEVQTYVSDRLSKLSNEITTFVNSDQGIITTMVSVPAGDLTAIGFLRATDIDLQVFAQMVQER